MALESYPHTSIVTYNEDDEPIYDRAVTAEFLRHFYKKDRYNGVLMLDDSTALQVTTTTPPSRNVVINTGYCFMEGAYGINHETITKAIDSAEPELNRFDTIVLRLNDNAEFRNIDVYVKKGTPAQTPQKPGLTRTELVYELGIADIYVPAASAYVEQQYIEDTRFYPGRCGISYPLQRIDTTNIATQYQAQLQSNIELIKAALDDVEAIHLQSEIDNIINNMIWPVDSVYLSFSSVCKPAQFITGSTWEQLDEGVVMRLAGNTQTGGHDTYTKTYGLGNLGEWYGTLIPWLQNFEPGDKWLIQQLYGDTGMTMATRSTDQGTVFRRNAALVPSHADETVSTHNYTTTQTHNNLPAYQNLYGWRRLS